MSLSKKLELLANPTPTFADPQDLDFDASRPTLVDFEEELDNTSREERSSLRRLNAVELTQNDERYHGKKISRKSLAELDSENDEDISNFDGTCDPIIDSSSEGNISSKEEDEDKLSETLEESDSGDEQVIDVSAEQDDEEYISDDESKIEATDGEETLRTFSNLNLEENAEKGGAVKSQLKLWDSLLECRIKLQRSLVAANMLPQYDVWQDFWKAGEDSSLIIRDCQTNVTTLLDSLIQLQSMLISSSGEFRQLMQSDVNKVNSEYGDEDIDIDNDNKIEGKNKPAKFHLGVKRKLSMPEYSDYLKRIHLDFETPRNAIIQKWDDKTKVSAGRLKKSFVGFEQSAVQQIQHILNDKDRLISRTQLKRSIYHVLGKTQNMDDGNNVDGVSYHESVLKQDSHLKDYDKEIFDDSDFYHQLLRELIEHKTTDVNDSNVLGRQWLEIQRLRSKMKKKVDTRASKGRKLRFDVHPKLASFMAPVQQSSMPEESRKELFGSLFGNLKSCNIEVKLDDEGIKIC